MSWATIQNNPYWEYNNAPANPGGAQTPLWLKQVNGIRTNPNGTKIYTCCRKVGSTVVTAGEINKSYYDNLS
jgi:hypothetical protein